jgi:hypothetical protein
MTKNWKKLSIQSSFLRISLNVLGLHSSQTSDSGAHGHGRSGRERVRSSGNSLAAGFAVPDSNTGALHGILSTECAMVSGMLGDFNLSKKLTKRGTISGSILSCDSDLLGTLSHSIILRSLKGEGGGGER